MKRTSQTAIPSLHVPKADVGILMRLVRVNYCSHWLNYLSFCFECYEIRFLGRKIIALQMRIAIGYAVGLSFVMGTTTTKLELYN